MREKLPLSIGSFECLLDGCLSRIYHPKGRLRLAPLLAPSIRVFAKTAQMLHFNVVGAVLRFGY